MKRSKFVGDGFKIISIIKSSIHISIIYDALLRVVDTHFPLKNIKNPQNVVNSAKKVSALEANWK